MVGAHPAVIPARVSVPDAPPLEEVNHQEPSRHHGKVRVSDQKTNRFRRRIIESLYTFPDRGFRALIVVYADEQQSIVGYRPAHVLQGPPHIAGVVQYPPAINHVVPAKTLQPVSIQNRPAMDAPVRKRSEPLVQMLRTGHTVRIVVEGDDLLRPKPQGGEREQSTTASGVQESDAGLVASPQHREQRVLCLLYPLLVQ